MPFIDIESEEDPRIEPFRSVRDRDLREGGAFIVEGEVVLPVLLGNKHFATQALLLSKNRAQHLAGTLPESIPVYVASQQILERIVGMPFHRGVLAVGARGRERTVDEVLTPASSLVLGLCGVTNHDNVGGIFRNAAAFGVDAVLYDEATCDPLYRKAIRVSSGGTLHVPFAQVPTEAAMIELLVSRGYEVLALSPRGALIIGGQQRPKSSRVAFLLGAEGPGLSEETLKHCVTARIPMTGTWDSLNVSVTSGIALAWLRANSSESDSPRSGEVVIEGA